VTPEARARERIDALLTAAGWVIQDREEMNLGAALGVAVREYPLPAGPCDYLLFIDRRACGVGADTHRRVIFVRVSLGLQSRRARETNCADWLIAEKTC
jgi:hypothetical protein